MPSALHHKLCTLWLLLMFFTVFVCQPLHLFTSSIRTSKSFITKQLVSYVQYKIELSEVHTDWLQTQIDYSPTFGKGLMSGRLLVLIDREYLRWFCSRQVNSLLILYVLLR